TEDPPHPQRAQRPHVGPVRDRVRRELVVDAVARQKRDLVHPDGAYRDRSARLAVRGVEVDASRIRTEERIEAAAADDSEHHSIVSSARLSARLTPSRISNTSVARPPIAPATSLTAVVTMAA